MQNLERNDMFLLVEVPDGHNPRLRFFGDVNLMVRHLAKLEGEQMNVFIAHGTPLCVTHPDSSGVRYLTDLSPNVRNPLALRLEARSASDAAVCVGENAALVRESYRLSDDGWLGDPALEECALPLLPTTFGRGPQPPEAIGGQVPPGTPGYDPLEGDDEDEQD